jgi:hypothetical protein
MAQDRFETQALVDTIFGSIKGENFLFTMEPVKSHHVY